MTFHNKTCNTFDDKNYEILFAFDKNNFQNRSIK